MGGLTTNALTLWERAFSPGQIPTYPTGTLLRAKGGETTFEPDPAYPEGPMVVLDRKAEVGELLRDSELMYLADWRENALYRVQVRVSCVTRAAQDVQRAFCRSSVLYFINTFCYVLDPRPTTGTRILPFVTYPFQDDFITWLVWLIRRKTEGVAEKSRDMGASWSCAAVAVWLTLFHDNMTDYFMSMNQNDVDSRTPDSLLGKCRFLLEHLPDWMRGGWEEKALGVDAYMNIRIPSTSSFIVGVLSKGTAARGGRTSILFADEWAFVEDSTNVLRSISALSGCKLFLSTANGKGNEHYRMVTTPGVIKKRLHWRKHPLKNDLWAARMRRLPSMTDEIWAREYEIDYEGSTLGRVFPQFISTADPIRPWCHVQEGPFFEYDPAYPVYAFSDLGINDPTSILFAQVKPCPPHLLPQNRLGTMLLVFAEHEERNMTVWETRHFLNSQPYRYARHIVDVRTGGARGHDGKTWMQRASQADVRPLFSERLKRTIDPGPPVFCVGKRNSETGPIESVRELLLTPGACAVNPNGAGHFIMALQSWSYPIDNATQKPQTGAPPNHDEWSHRCKAFCYGVDWLHGLLKPPGSGPDVDWEFPTRIRSSR